MLCLITSALRLLAVCKTHRSQLTPCDVVSCNSFSPECQTTLGMGCSIRSEEKGGGPEKGNGHPLKKSVSGSNSFLHVTTSNCFEYQLSETCFDCVLFFLFLKANPRVPAQRLNGSVRESSPPLSVKQIHCNQGCQYLQKVTAGHCTTSLNIRPCLQLTFQLHDNRVKDIEKSDGGDFYLVFLSAFSTLKGLKLHIIVCCVTVYNTTNLISIVNKAQKIFSVIGYKQDLCANPQYGCYLSRCAH